MLRKEDGIKAVNTLRNPYLKGRRVFLEIDNNKLPRGNYIENNAVPYNNWMEPGRDVGGPMEFGGMPHERNMHHDMPNQWRQEPIQHENPYNGSRQEE